LDLVTFRLEAIINLKSDNSRDQFEERDRFWPKISIAVLSSGYVPVWERGE
jgi:hypothetical protein